MHEDPSHILIDELQRQLFEIQLKPRSVLHVESDIQVEFDNVFSVHCRVELLK